MGITLSDWIYVRKRYTHGVRLRSKGNLRVSEYSSNRVCSTTLFALYVYYKRDIEDIHNNYVFNTINISSSKASKNVILLFLFRHTYILKCIINYFKLPGKPKYILTIYGQYTEHIMTIYYLKKHILVIYGGYNDHIMTI